MFNSTVINELESTEQHTDKKGKIEEMLICLKILDY